MAKVEADYDKEQGKKVLMTTQYKGRIVEKNNAICLLKTACNKRYGRLTQNIIGINSHLKLMFILQQ